MGEAVTKIEGNADLLEAFKPYETFCRAMLDAYALVDRYGRVVKSNQLFSQLVDKKARQIQKAGSFDDLLQLYINDRPLPVAEILKNYNPTRIDEVRGVNHKTDKLNLIIGVNPFFANENASAETHLGSFVLIRDVTAETNLQVKYRHTALKSITDPLTGLYTRGYFEDYLNLQMAAMKQLSSEAEHRNVTIVLIDIDFFKKVNDVYGHQAGDYVLKRTSQMMQKTFRKTDVVCRYGGEEFLVILPTTDLYGAVVAVEKLREVVEEEDLDFEGTPIKITVSTGLAQIRVGDEEYEDTIARADEALYASKRNGRNQTTLHTGERLIKANLQI